MAKRHSYVQKIFSHTWKETEWASVFVEDMLGGVITAAGALALHICQWDEFRELAFLAIGGALVSFALSFIFRLVFITPAKLHKEMEKRIKSLESKTGEGGGIEAPEKYRTPIAMTFLLCLSACLAVLLIAQNNKFKNRPISPPQASIPKPLPTKVIPRPEPPPEAMPVTATQQLAVVQPQALENFNAPTGDIGDFSLKIAKIKSDMVDKAEAENHKVNLDIQKWWDVYLPHYRHTLVVLHDVLASEALKTGDGIVQSADYFQSLPPTIDPKKGGFQIARIGFQKDTNMDFTVTVTGLNGGYLRYLEISCPGCVLQLSASWGEQLNDDFPSPPPDGSPN